MQQHPTIFLQINPKNSTAFDETGAIGRQFRCLPTALRRVGTATAGNSKAAEYARMALKCAKENLPEVIGRPAYVLEPAASSRPATRL
jgi:hypothetical protein